MRINFSISLDDEAADILIENSRKQGIPKSKYINDILKMQQKTPREKIVGVVNALDQCDHLDKKGIKEIQEVIKKNINKI